MNAWDLQPDRILKRSRIMNQRLSQGKFVHESGIPSYTEGRTTSTLETASAAEYRAFESLRVVAISHHQTLLAQQYENAANGILNLIQNKAWSQQDSHFIGFFSRDGVTWIRRRNGLYFGATKDPGRIRAALSHIESMEYLKGIGIEVESYLPQTLYRYGEKDAAYRIIMDLTRPDKDRRDYPEASFSVIGAMVTGMMGMEVVDDGNRGRPLLRSISQLRSASDRAKLSGVRVRDNLVDLEHVTTPKTLSQLLEDADNWQAPFRAGLRS